MAKPKYKPHPDQINLPGIDPDLQEKLEFAKPPAANGKKKKESGNGPTNLAKAVKVCVPDFSMPNRPKTCLEVDFPILRINELSALEGSAGKPIYQMSKWWARRRSSVFRAMLIAAAMEAPATEDDNGKVVLDEDGIPVPDATKAARAVWDVYYANHQKAENFKNLKVLDCFMGGGTTLVEGSRLGFQVAGVDLNPVAWFVVKNELACTDPKEVRKFFDQIESEVKPAVQPFYVTDCPRGHCGQWFKLAGTDNPADDERMPDDFNPISLSSSERKEYRYDGPEVIYTFWAKHGKCTKPGCGHRTPVFRTPVIAEKKLGVKYVALTCKSPTCKTRFHAELGAARMAPMAERIILDTETPFTELSQPFSRRFAEYSKGKKEEKQLRVQELCDMVGDEPGLCCPKCGEFAGQFLRDVLKMHNRATRVSAIDKKHLKIEPQRNSTKPVYCHLLIDPLWLQGAPGSVSGNELGGHSDATVEATANWYEARLRNLSLIEVRGRIKLSDDVPAVRGDASLAEDMADDEVESGEAEGTREEVEVDRKQYGLPQIITLGDGRQIYTRKGTVPRNSHFTCGKCGSQQDLREAIQACGHSAPKSPYTIQGYCPACKTEGQIYSGRYFLTPSTGDMTRLVDSENEWLRERDGDLRDFWPRDEIPRTYMTAQANFALQDQGFTHWYRLFDSLHLLVHAQLLKAIERLAPSQELKEQALGAFQQFLRMLNNQGFWNVGFDKMNPFFSNANYFVKSQIVTTSPFGKLGYGRWSACAEKVLDGLEWAREPWELSVPERSEGRKSDRLLVNDPVRSGANLRCHSSSDMDFPHQFDLIITDPPFGDNLYYSDLADFFYVWIRVTLRTAYPKLFELGKTPNAQEAVSPRSLTNREAETYYYDRLMACFAESGRVLKESGLMAFTFHHSDDAQWEVVLRSLFDAGFCLEQTFPITSDEVRGKAGEFGAKGTEYDIIHVCRKRLDEPTQVSWPKMRQWVKAELTRLKPLLAAYKLRELSKADIRLILRGKALEFYSKHYGQVFSISSGEREVLSIQTALAGINQLLNEDSEDAATLPPSSVHPEAYEFLRLFGIKPSMTTENVKKSLYSTTIQLRDLEGHGWVQQQGKQVRAIPIRDRFEHCRKRPRKEMKTELDQAHFLIGGAMTGDVNLGEELTKDTWMISPYVAAVLDWYGKFSPESKTSEAAKLAADILRRTREKLREKPEFVDRQQRLFEMEDEEW